MSIHTYIERERGRNGHLRLLRGFIGWANNHFNNLHVKKTVETKKNA